MDLLNRLVSDRRRAIGLAICVALALMMIILWRIFALTDGRQPYSLDDPYIHLSVARTIAQGHYGITPGVASAPSSSIIWPLLLVPVAMTEFATWAPLILNLGLALATIATVITFFYNLPATGGGHLKPFAAFALALAAVVLANVIGVAFTGLEHSLQLFLTALVALGLVRAYQGQAPSWWLVLACCLLPLVRYDNLPMVLAAGIGIWAQDRRNVALAIIAIPLAGVIAFSMFLSSQGLGILPTSVAAKSSALAKISGVNKGTVELPVQSPNAKLAGKPREPDSTAHPTTLLGRIVDKVQLDLLLYLAFTVGAIVLGYTRSRVRHAAYGSS